MTAFAERLRRLRREAGLSQAELAGADLSASYVSLLESGRRTPGPDVLHTLARRLGCSVSLLEHGEPAPRERQLELRMAFARLALDHGEVEEARERFSALLHEADLPAPVRDESTFLAARANLRLGEHAEAARLLLPLVERALDGDSQLPVPMVATPLTWLYLQLGSAVTAIGLAERALAATREQGLAGTDEYFRLAANLMTAYSAVGDDAHAASWADRVIAEAEAAGSRSGQAALYWNAAIIAERLGRVEEALLLCRRAMARLADLDDGTDLARVQVAAAVILLAADPPRAGEALAALERTGPLLGDLGSEADLGEWDLARSWVALLHGDPATAERHARASTRRLDDLAGAEAALPARAQLALADALTAQGRDEEAAEHLQFATRALDAGGTDRATAYAWRELAQRLTERGDGPAAARAYERALDLAGVRDRTRAVRSAARAARTAPLGTALLGTAPVSTAPVGTAPVGTAPLGSAPATA